MADHFEKNTPYDVIVRDLLEAKGSWTDFTKAYGLAPFR